MKNWRIFARYLLVLLLSLGNLYLFYYIFSPLTLILSAFILKLFYSSVAIMPENIISIGNITISLIPACIAVSAYYLLFILNMSIPLKAEERAKSLLFLFTSFLFLNVIRIVLFASLFKNNFTYFNETHEAVWLFSSTLLVIALWFINIRLFRIKSIPFYTDFLSILRSIK